MPANTFFGLLLTPVFYVLVRRLALRRAGRPPRMPAVARYGSEKH